MRKRLLTMLAKLGMIGLLPSTTQNWLTCWYRFQQLSPERQQTLREWSRDELIGTLLAHQLDPASGWMRTRLSPRQLEQRLRGHSRMALLDEVGYSLPDTLPDPVLVSGMSARGPTRLNELRSQTIRDSLRAHWWSGFAVGLGLANLLIQFVLALRST